MGNVKCEGVNLRTLSHARTTGSLRESEVRSRVKINDMMSVPKIMEISKGNKRTERVRTCEFLTVKQLNNETRTRRE